MKYITETEMNAVYSMNQCIEDVKQGFRLYKNNKTHVPVRTILNHSKAGTNTLFMPSYIEDLEYETVKVVSIFPENAEENLPSLQSVIVLSETNNGKHIALLDSSKLTVMRTGAASGIATDYLAIPDASTLTILGCGRQARGQLDAVMQVRNINRIFLWNRTTENAQIFKEEIDKLYPEWQGEIIASETANEAVSQADIIVLSTKSEESLFDAEFLKPGAHINAIGAYRSDLKEFGVDTLSKVNQVWVDSIEAVKHEAGDLIQPADKELWSWDKVNGEIADLVTGQKQGRQKEKEITLFKSVGVGYMDTVVAAKVYENTTKNKK